MFEVVSKLIIISKITAPKCMQGGTKYENI